MPRTAREKTENSIFHIMVRSISEVDLFKNDKDKQVYLNLMKKYQNLYHFKLYAFCLMNNHAHLLIDVNGADISSVMHSVNLSYAKYFNKEHSRHGHLFQDRFKSKIVSSDRYLKVVTGYIHNNPVDLNGYEGSPEEYSFSSLPAYLGLTGDKSELLDYNFINSFFRLNVKSENDVAFLVREDYLDYVKRCNDPAMKKEVDFSGESSEYVSSAIPLLRNFNVHDVMSFVAEKTGIDCLILHAKNNRIGLKSRALAAFLLRSLCNCRCSDICRILGNITQSRASALTRIGLALTMSDIACRQIVIEFVSVFNSA
jgi:REP element-mobilizing transposase RayT